MSDSVREAFEAFAAKHMRRNTRQDGPFLRECGDIDPQRTYELFDIEDAWLDWQAATAAADAECRGVVEKLVEALKIAQEAAECFPDVHDGRVEPLQIIEHLHEWEAKYITFGQVAGAEKALAQAEKLMGRK